MNFEKQIRKWLPIISLSVLINCCLLAPVVVFTLLSTPAKRTAILILDSYSFDSQENIENNSSEISGQRAITEVEKGTFSDNKNNISSVQATPEETTTNEVQQQDEVTIEEPVEVQDNSDVSGEFVNPSENNAVVENISVDSQSAVASPEQVIEDLGISESAEDLQGSDNSTVSPAGEAEQDAVFSDPQKAGGLYCPEPEYPVALQRNGIGGIVKVKIDISAAGKVQGIEILESSGNRILDKKVEEAVFYKWRFRKGDSGRLLFYTFRFTP